MSRVFRRGKRKPQIIWGNDYRLRTMGQQAEADAIAGEEAEDSRRRMPALTGIDLSIAVGEGMLADLHGEDDVFDE